MTPPSLPSSQLWLFLPLLLLTYASPPSAQAQSLQTSLADGFDFPVGKPDAQGYYRARGYRPNGHLGEDWNGRGGGNSDLGDPVYAVANGVVVYSANYRQGWGNVIIVRHAYRERNGRINFIDSLYGHLGKRMVQLNDRVLRGQQIGTIGNNDGMYWAHLHLEMRRNLEIGMHRSGFARDDRNYLCPTTFIEAHRALPQEFRLASVPRLGEQSTSTPGSAFDREMDRFLAQHHILRRNGDPSPEPKSGPVYLTAAEDRPEAAEERAKVRAFWQKLRGA